MTAPLDPRHQELGLAAPNGAVPLPGEDEFADEGGSRESGWYTAAPVSATRAATNGPQVRETPWPLDAATLSTTRLAECEGMEITLTACPARPDGFLVVAVDGEVDLSNADDFRAGLVGIVEQVGPNVVIDLAELSFITSQGINALTVALEQAQRLGGTFRLAAPRRPIAKVLRITGLWDVLRVFPSVEAACSPR